MTRKLTMVPVVTDPNQLTPNIVIIDDTPNLTFPKVDPNKIELPPGSKVGTMQVLNVQLK